MIKDQALENTERTEDGIETTDGSQLPIEQNQLQTLELHNMDLQVVHCDNLSHWLRVAVLLRSPYGSASQPGCCGT